jgi:hypothetical protein
MFLQIKGLLSWLWVFRRHPEFERSPEQRRTVPECATRRICGSAKGHGFIRAMRRATNSFLVAFRPCLVPQRLKPAKGASRLDNIGTGLSRVVAARLPMEIIGTGSIVPFRKSRPDLRGAHLARRAVDLSRRSLSGCASRERLTIPPCGTAPTRPVCHSEPIRLSS